MTDIITLKRTRGGRKGMFSSYAILNSKVKAISLSQGVIDKLQCSKPSWARVGLSANLNFLYIELISQIHSATGNTMHYFRLSSGKSSYRIVSTSLFTTLGKDFQYGRYEGDSITYHDHIAGFSTATNTQTKCNIIIDLTQKASDKPSVTRQNKRVSND